MYKIRISTGPNYSYLIHSSLHPVLTEYMTRYRHKRKQNKDTPLDRPVLSVSIYMHVCKCIYITYSMYA
jgi:hypothetical protein